MIQTPEVMLEACGVHATLSVRWILQVGASAQVVPRHRDRRGDRKNLIGLRR